MIDFLTSLIVLGFTVALFIGIAYIAVRVLLAVAGWFTDSLLPVIVGALIIGLITITVTGVAGAIFG